MHEALDIERVSKFVYWLANINLLGKVIQTICDLVLQLVEINLRYLNMRQMGSHLALEGV